MANLFDDIKRISEEILTEVMIREDNGRLTITGDLYFKSYYNEKERYFTTFYSGEKNPNVIEGFYRISISFADEKAPEVKDLTGKIARTARLRNINVIDMHYPKLVACLSSPDILLQYFKLKDLDYSRLYDFFHFVLIPFFYAQTFFSLKGRWPWRNLEHGVVGLFEEFGERQSVLLYLMIIDRIKSNKQITAKLKNYKIRGHRKCICESNRKFRNCNKEALHGLIIFKDYHSNFVKVNKKFLLNR